MAKEKLSKIWSESVNNNEIKETVKKSIKKIVVDIDNYEWAKWIMQHILDWEIKKNKITKKIVKDLAKAGVFHKWNNRILGYLLVDDYMEIFWDILSKEDVIFLINKSYEIEKAKNTHTWRSIFDIEDEIDKYFKKIKKQAA